MASMQRPEDQDLLLARLLNTADFSFVPTTRREHFSSCAILSHRWVGNEISMQKYKDFTKASGNRLPDIVDIGFVALDDRIAAQRISNYTKSLEQDEVNSVVKILKFCRKARQEGLQYAWVDTACIDKTDNIAIAKAFNSMWQYYSQSAKCFGYLNDVSEHSTDWRHEDNRNVIQAIGRFEASQWFTRGMHNCLMPET